MFQISTKNGHLTFRGQELSPLMPAELFLNSELYNRYSLDRIHLLQLEFQRRIVLWVDGFRHPKEMSDLTWSFSFDFKPMQLRTVMMHICRKSMAEINTNTDDDIGLYRQLLTELLGDDGLKQKSLLVSYVYSWGFVKVTFEPDGVVPKILIRYKLSR